MVDGRPEASNGARPFFIVGGRYSGSDHLFQLLEAHPEIALTNEARLVDALCFCFDYCTQPAGRVNIDSGLRGVVHPDVIPRFSEVFLAHARQMLQEYYAAAFDKPFTRWGDTLYEPGWAVATQRIFPEVQFVVPVRDPRDVFCARRNHGIRSGAAFEAWANAPLEEQAEGWRQTYDYMVNAPGDKHVVSYERLVADPHGCADELLRFLGLQMDPAVERAAKAVLETEAQSVGRWQDRLDPAAARTIEEVCGPLMKQFGYA